MGATGTPKPGARRFCLCATGEIGYYIACDLDEGRLRFWEETRSRGYSSLLLSENREERRAAFEVIRRHAESEYCVGVELTERQTADMESLLTPDCIESMRGITNDSMAQRSQYFCYRDGWSLSFYAEGDDGLPPLSLNGITWCSFMDDELPFELLESYVGSEILNNRCEAFPYDVSHNAIPEKTRQIVTKALEVGMEAIDEVLWYGTRRLLIELDNTEIGGTSATSCLMILSPYGTETRFLEDASCTSARLARRSLADDMSFRSDPDKVTDRQHRILNLHIQAGCTMDAHLIFA